MQSPHPQPILPAHLRSTHRSYLSLIFLTLWLLLFFIELASVDSGILSPLYVLTLLSFLASPILLIALWFSIQYDLARHYLPAFSSDEWSGRTAGGTFLGTIAGLLIGVSGLFFIRDDMVSRGRTWIFLGTSIVGLLIGFGILGWHQVRVLHRSIDHSWLWVPLLSLAWVPVVLTYFLYDTFLSSLTINIFPDLHNLTRFMALQVALISPILSAFAILLTLNRPGTSPPPPLPRFTLAVLATPLLVVVLTLGGLLVAHFQRIERAWIAPGPLYLRVDSSGQIFTAPSPNEAWGPSTALYDISSNRSLRAQASDTQITLLSTSTNSPILTIPLFTKSQYSDIDDKINIVRFSPNGTLLATGTGQAYAYDSATSRSEDHAVHIWSIPDGTPLYTLTEPRYSVRSLAWSPDGQYLAAAGGLAHNSDMRFSDNLIRIWRFNPSDHTTPPTLIFTLTGHTSTVGALAWTPDSTQLISRDLNGLIAIWHIK